MIRFEWNSNKERVNREKHGVSFQEARSVFFDEQALQFFDDQHSDNEDRFIMLGVSGKLRILVVIHCEKENGKVIRTIWAWKATSSELRIYLGENR